MHSKNQLRVSAADSRQDGRGVRIKAVMLKGDFLKTVMQRVTMKRYCG